MNFLKQLLLITSILLMTANSFALGLKKDSIVIIDNHYAVISEPSPIEVTFNDQVQAVSDIYQNNDFSKLKNMLDRGRDWFPMIEKIFNEVGVPTELKYLAFIESGFNTRVYSRAGARGMWQFMRFTGMHYGLKINRYTDERTSPEKATYAAALYFKKLYAQYNDWQMVAAAYNCGEGMLDAAIEKANGATDFWEVYKFLPRETQKYVPHLLGIMDAMNSFAAQAELAAYMQTHSDTNSSATVLTASTNNDLSIIASSASTTSTKNEATNSSGVAPVVMNNSTTIEQPKTVAPKVEKEIYQKEFFVYIIKPGDSMESISKQFPKNTIAAIKENNYINSNAELNTGSTLLLEK